MDGWVGMLPTGGGMISLGYSVPWLRFFDSLPPLHASNSGHSLAGPERCGQHRDSIAYSIRMA